MILSDSSHIFKSGAPLYEIRIGSESLWKTETIPSQEIWYKTVSGNSVVPRQMTMVSNQRTASGIYIAKFACPVICIRDARSYREGCFSYTDVENVWMPDILKVIGSRCFQGCSDLRSFTISPEITGIGSFAFSGCTGLKELMILPEVPPILGTDAFKGVDPGIPVYVVNPKTYRGWGGFKNIMKL
jgi:hypothetical protein